jgi:hypothetical protein
VIGSEKVPELQFSNPCTRATFQSWEHYQYQVLDMVDSGKKRKRNDEGVPKPNKKIAIQAPAPVKNVNVSVITGTDDWVPIVGTLNPGPRLFQP